MKVGEFQNKLGVSSKSYLSFMRQNGPHAGMGNNTYRAAQQWFTQMEDMGVKMPKKKTPSKKDNADDDKKYDVSDNLLEGEDAGNVPVFDTCDDVRTKITAHLRTTSVTQAAFCRAISTCQGTGPSATPIQSAQMTSFLRKKGPLAGNTSKAFYASYVYFEKLRIKQAKKKSKKREERRCIGDGKG